MSDNTNFLIVEILYEYSTMGRSERILLLRIVASQIVAETVQDISVHFYNQSQITC